MPYLMLLLYLLSSLGFFLYLAVKSSSFDHSSPAFTLNEEKDLMAQNIYGYQFCSVLALAAITAALYGGEKAIIFTLIAGVMGILFSVFGAISLDSFFNKKIKKQEMTAEENYKKASLYNILVLDKNFHKYFINNFKSQKVQYAFFMSQHYFNITSKETDNISIEIRFFADHIIVRHLLGQDNIVPNEMLSEETISYDNLKEDKYRFIMAKVDELALSFDLLKEEKIKKDLEKENKQREELKNKELEKENLLAKEKRTKEEEREKKKEMIEKAKSIISSQSFHETVLKKQIKENIEAGVERLELEDKELKEELKEKLYQKEMTDTLNK